MRGKVPRFILTRHGQTQWSLERRFQGHSDTALIPAGVYQAERLRDRLSCESLTAIYASDLERARHTAQIVASAHHLPVRVVPGLREICFGCFEGKTWDEIREAYPEASQAWWVGMSTICPPGGESLQDFVERVTAVAHRLQEAHAGETILLVTHGGTARALLCAFLGWDLSHFWRWRVDNTSLSVVEDGPLGWRLVLLNDTCHLDGVR